MKSAPTPHAVTDDQIKAALVELGDHRKWTGAKVAAKIRAMTGIVISRQALNRRLKETNIIEAMATERQRLEAEAMSAAFSDATVRKINDQVDQINDIDATVAVALAKVREQLALVGSEGIPVDSPVVIVTMMDGVGRLIKSTARAKKTLAEAANLAPAIAGKNPETGANIIDLEVWRKNLEKQGVEFKS